MICNVITVGTNQGQGQIENEVNMHFEPEKSNGQFLTELEGKCDKINQPNY